MSVVAAETFSPQRLETWLDEIGFAARRLEALPGDVSPRRYFRVRLVGRSSAILAVYPESLGDAADRFLRTTTLLEEADVRVPRVLAAEPGRGLMLLEDLGEQTLFERDFDWDERAKWLARGAESLVSLRRVDPELLRGLNPALDGALLRRELVQTWELFLLPSGLTGQRQLADDLHGALDEICARIGSAPLVPCHRDYMARNLVPLADGRLAVLDHQDLRLGPPGYDWASLLNDSLFAPAAVEAAVLGIAERVGLERDSYHGAAVQRGFKAIGTFIAFARRGSDRHLSLVRPTLERALEHLAALPRHGALAAALGRVLEPGIC